MAGSEPKQPNDELLWTAPDQQERLRELLGQTAEIKEKFLRRDVSSLGRLLGNVIKEQFLATRDWPFGSTLAILLTLAVLLTVLLVAKLTSKGGRYA